MKLMRVYKGDNLLIKRCSKCKLVKDVKEFSNNKKISDGLQNNCNSCLKEYKKQHYENNKDYYKEYAKEYQKTDKYKEHRKEYMKTDRYKDYRKEYMKTPEGKAAQKRAKHKRRTLKLGNGGKYTADEWNSCLAYFDYKDSYTGEPMDIISIDHIIPVSKRGTNNIGNIVPCEKNINSSKHNSDLFEWYSQQPYFSWDRYLKICFWIIKNM